MMKIDYPVFIDGFAYLATCEEVQQYFYDNDVIGKTVKCADLYVIGHNVFDFSKPREGFDEYKHKGLDLKMCYFGDYDTYFVCEFTDGTYLEIDYSVDPGVYIKYGNELTFPDTHIEHIQPELYNNLLDNLIGTKLKGICLPTEFRLQKDYIYTDKLYDYHFLGFLFLDFENYEYDLKENKTIFFTNDQKYYHDSLGFYCEIWHWPMIAYLSDRDIPFFESTKRE